MIPFVSGFHAVVHPGMPQIEELPAVATVPVKYSVPFPE